MNLESSTQLLFQIDPVCERFEDAWQGNAVPRIEEFLEGWSYGEREVLFRHLLELELDYRRQRGDQLQVSDYVARFAEMAETVRAVFQEDSSTPSFDTAVTTTYEPRTHGKFQLLQQVGSGAFGAVWKARDTELGRTVAVKILHPSLVFAPSDHERFLREARAAAQLRHPGIVTLFEVAEVEGLPAIVSMFVEGVTLRELLQVRALTPRESASVVAQVADALDYAHSMKLVHRDIKPANLMIEYGPGEGLSTSLDPMETVRASGASTKSSSGVVASSSSGPRALLLDFGLALREDAEATMTADGQIVGTPAYMSPEQAAGDGHRVDGRSDVYALGVVLYELLAGETPFRGNKVTMLHQVLSDEPRPPRSIRPTVPRDLEVVCLKAMAKERSKRYPTARELGDDLRRYLAGEPILARRAGAVERLVRWSRRNRPLAASLVVIAVLLVAATIASAIAAGHFRRLARNETELRRQAQQAEQNEAAERTKAETAREETRRNLYFAEMNLAASVAESPSGVAQLSAIVNGWNLQPEQRDLRGWEWRLFRAISRDELAVIDLKVNSMFVVWSPDGKRIATAGRNGIAFWDPDTKTQVGGWSAATEGVSSADWSPNGKLIAAVGGSASSGFLEVRDPISSRLVLRMNHAREIRSVAWHPAGEIIAGHGWDNSIHVWHVPSNQEIAVLGEAVPPDKPMAGPPSKIGFSHDGKYFASHARGQKYPDAAVRVWETESWTVIHTFDGFERPVEAITWSPESHQLAASTQVGEIVVLDVATRQVVRSLRKSGHITEALAWSPDGSRLVAGNAGFFIQIWNPADGQDLTLHRGHTEMVRAICWSPDGNRLASVGADGTLRIWNGASAPPVRTINLGQPETQVAFLSVAWKRDGTALATSIGNVGTKIWDARRGDVMQTLQGVGASWNFDGNHAASLYGEVVTIWDRNLTQSIKSFEIRGQPKSLAWNPHDNRLAIQAARQIWLWEVDQSHEPLIVFGQASPPGSVPWQPGGAIAWSHDGKRLAFSVEEQGRTSVRLWDPTTARIVREIAVPNLRIESIVWSPNGERLAVAGSDPIVRIWDTTTGRESLALAGHTFKIHSLAWHPDGSRLASASADGSVKLWDTASGQLSVSFPLSGEVRSVAWSDDGTGLSAISEGGTFKIWSASNAP